MARVRGAHHGDPGLNPFWRRLFNDIVSTDRSEMHQVERDYMIPRQVLGLTEEIPGLRFDNSLTIPWTGPFDAEKEDFAIVHAATRWESKAWPMDRWRNTIEKILEFTPRLIVSCGPSEREVSESNLLCEGFGGRVVTTAGRASWAQLAWLLRRSRYYVGVDTAAMHLAAAMQCPIVSLFGESIPGQFGPWKCPNVMVAPAGRAVGETPGSTNVESPRMLAIEVEHVVSACVQASTMEGEAI
jgi:heptosyltransferase-3